MQIGEVEFAMTEASNVYVPHSVGEIVEHHTLVFTMEEWERFKSFELWVDGDENNIVETKYVLRKLEEDGIRFSHHDYTLSGYKIYQKYDAVLRENNMWNYDTWGDEYDMDITSYRTKGGENLIVVCCYRIKEG